LFGLDTALLRSGGRELIRTQGRLGQVLFAAGGGMGRVRELSTALEAKRDELGRATVRHKARPLWSALSAWEQAGMDLRRVALRPEGWTKMERDATDAAQKLEALLAEQKAGMAERDHLRTIGATRPWLDRLRDARERLANTAGAPELDNAFEQRWRDALEAGAKTASIADAAQASLAAATEARAALTFDPTWLEAETAIDALAELRGVAQGAMTDLPKRQSEMTELAAKSARSRQDLGWDPAMVPPPAPDVLDAQRRLRRYPKLAADAAAAERERADAERALAAAQAELDALPGEIDVAHAADLAQRLRSGGDPAARLDAGRHKLRLAEAALAKALAAVPDRALSEDALAATVAPSDPRLDAADKALAAAEAAHKAAVRDRAERVAEIDRERERLANLEQAALLPPPDALRETRDRRDRLWAGLRDAAWGRPRSGEPAGEPPDPAAAIELDRAMHEADAVADSLIAHGREVAEAASLRSRLARLGAEHAKDQENVARTMSDLVAARNELAAIAEAAGGNAPDMAGLRAFLRARADAVLRRGERDAAAAELADTSADLTCLGHRLAKAMDMPRCDPTALGSLLSELDRRVAAATNLATTRALLTKRSREQRSVLAAKAAAAQTADRALKDWHEQWAPVARMLARPEGEAPAMTADALALVEELRRTDAETDSLRRRIEEMHAAISLLAGKVRGLAGLSPEFAGLPPIEAADAFRRRLEHERREAARCKDADERIERAVRHLAIARTDAEAATRTLIGLRAALGAETNEIAERQLQRARVVAQARKDAAGASRELAVQGGGLGTDALAARAAETTAEADTARISAIDARHAELTSLIAAARDKAAAAANALDLAGSGLEASEAARRREAAQSMLARTAEEALVLHAAHALLRAALDRRANGANRPLLARIGEVFRTITGGAQAGVTIEETRDGQTMVALEADGTTRKLLDQLSEGTSDQLYLALRIAALEDYAAAASPLPFIADDVLQTFDDPRTAATLRALLGLSDRVQVIALTHHTHVGDLAATLPAGAVNVIRLGG
jgi:hypothetical protein